MWSHCPARQLTNAIDIHLPGTLEQAHDLAGLLLQRDGFRTSDGWLFSPHAQGALRSLLQAEDHHLPFISPVPGNAPGHTADTLEETQGSVRTAAGRFRGIKDAHGTSAPPPRSDLRYPLKLAGSANGLPESHCLARSGLKTALT